jgi:hypothetical protein
VYPEDGGDTLNNDNYVQRLHGATIKKTATQMKFLSLGFHGWSAMYNFSFQV